MGKSRSFHIKLWLCLALWFALPFQYLEAVEIAIVKSNDIGPYNQALLGFKSAISADFIEYDLKGDKDTGARVMQEIRRRRPALIFAVGSLAALMSKQWLTDIPVVCTLVLNAEAKELSGENITSISIEIEPETQLREFLALMPKVRTVGMLYSKSTENVVTKVRNACEKAGVKLVSSKLEHSGDVPQAVEYLLPRIDALWLIPDGTAVNKDSIPYLILTTLENRIPLLVYTLNFVKAGALLSLSVDFVKIGRQAAQVSQKILQGKKDSTNILPPEDIDLAINENAAHRLGIEIPQTIIESARYVFQ